MHNSFFGTVLEDGYLPADTLPTMYSDYLFDGNRTMVFTDDAALREQNSTWTYYPNVNINTVFSKNGSIGANLKDAPVFTHTFSGTEFSIYASQTLRVRAILIVSMTARLRAAVHSLRITRPRW